jgi:hypothetical protein
MLRHLTICVLLCCLLAGGVQAEPITYRQVQPDRRLLAFIAVGSLSARFDGQDQRPRAEESPTHPEFVRLPDGRIVPYGPGVICAEDCIEPFEAAGPRRPWWWAAPPLITGGVVCAALCGGGDRGRPTAVGGVALPPPITIIPEPTTLILLGLGLALLARHHFVRLRSRRAK